MVAYFTLNNNEISKEHLVNKFNMILDNQGRFMMNDQKIPLSNEPQRSLGFVQKQSPEVLCKKGVLKKFGNFLKSLKTLLKRDSNTGVKFAKFLRTSILKNICERLLLCVSPQNTIANSSGTSVCTRRDLERVQSKYFFKNITILFDQMQAYHLYIS